MLTVAVVGCGYWGPNLIRNFVFCPDTELRWCCDIDEKRLNMIMKPFPMVRITTELADILKDKAIDAVAIATPVNTHFPLAKRCLEAGKHVLLEKPLATNVAQGEELVQLAQQKGLQLMCDHVFCYSSAVRKINEMVQAGELGKLLYFDSVRINLGLFQPDINVIWDLAPHDLSFLDYLIDLKPVSVSAQGICHAGNSLENIAYLTLLYEDNFIAHLHLNWLSPVKIRRTIIGGSQKMVVWNDLDQAEKIRIYDKGIEVQQVPHEERNRILVSYRYGNMYSPKVEMTEALTLVIREFVDSIIHNRPSLTDGWSALRILHILEAAQKSVKNNGENTRIHC